MDYEEKFYKRTYRRESGDPSNLSQAIEHWERNESLTPTFPFQNSVLFLHQSLISMGEEIRA